MSESRKQFRLEVDRTDRMGATRKSRDRGISALFIDLWLRGAIRLGTEHGTDRMNWIMWDISVSTGYSKDSGIHAYRRTWCTIL